MKKAFIQALILSAALVFPAFAAEEGSGVGTGPNFENRKAQILKHLDERITRIQQEKACVQAAKSMDDVKVCRDKFGPPQNPGAQGGMGAAGRGGPGGQGSASSPQGK